MNADDDRRDGHEPPYDEPGFEDPDHAWVRDLLADARVTGPVPDDVAARLDETLAALQVRRSGDLAASEPSPLAPVVPLRRRLGPALVAAATVVAVVGLGFGVVNAVHRSTSGSSATSSADSAAGSAAESQSGLDSAKKEPPAAAAPLTLRGVPELTTASFGPDAARVMQQIAGTADYLASQSTRSPAPSDSPDGTTATSGSKTLEAPPVTATPRAPFGVQDSIACQGPAIAGSVTLQALLDGNRVALVFLPPTATGQEVQAWSCAGATKLASATVAR